jgi:hypothetical protein
VLRIWVAGSKACSVARAVGQRVRHSLRWVGRPLDVWKADRPGARRRAELDALNLDVLALTGALQQIIERAAGLAEGVGPVGNDDRRLKLHAPSIARRELNAASSFPPSAARAREAS